MTLVTPNFQFGHIFDAVVIARDGSWTFDVRRRLAVSEDSLIYVNGSEEFVLPFSPTIEILFPLVSSKTNEFLLVAFLERTAMPQENGVGI